MRKICKFRDKGIAKSGFIAYFPLVARGVDDEDPSTFKHFLIVDDFLNVKTLRAKTFYF